MHSGMCVHICIAFTFMLITGVLSSFPIRWLCLGTQSAINSCAAGLSLCCIDGCIAVFLEAYVAGLLHHSCRFPPMFCDLLSCLRFRWSGSGGISLIHGASLQPFFQWSILCFSTGQDFACQSYWPQSWVIRCILLWELYSSPHLQKTCS